MMPLTETQRLRLAQDMRDNPIRYYRPRRTAALFHADSHFVRMASGGNSIVHHHVVVFRTSDSQDLIVMKRKTPIHVCLTQWKKVGPTRSDILQGHR